MRTRSTLLFLVFGLLLTSATFASAKEATTLTPEKVRALLKTLPEVSDLGEEYDAADDPLPQIAGGDETAPQAAAERMRSGMLSGAVPQLRAHSAWSKFQAITARHGFDSVEEWANVGDRVMAGFLQLQLAKEAPDLQAQMDEARESILGNPNIPEAQKKMMLEQFERQMGMFDALQHSDLVQPGDMAVIEPMADEISAVLQPE